MNDNSPLKEKEVNNSDRMKIKDYEQFFNQNKLRLLPPTNPTTHFKALASPRFLGSYHLKQGTDPRYNSFNAILKGDLEIKYAKGLRSAILNPVTIAIIIIAIIFNILWFFVL
ncbi:MAG: hypothetical protein ACFFKA_19515 [Candidatus Thorarchaeota archaeon]